MGYLGSIPGVGRSPGEGKGYLLQCSGLKNSMDSIVHGVIESDRTKLLSLSQLGLAIPSGHLGMAYLGLDVDKS